MTMESFLHYFYGKYGMISESFLQSMIGKPGYPKIYIEASDRLFLEKSLLKDTDWNVTATLLLANFGIGSNSGTNRLLFF